MWDWLSGLLGESQGAGGQLGAATGKQDSKLFGLIGLGGKDQTAGITQQNSINAQQLLALMQQQGQQQRPQQQPMSWW
jgi:hypothetical protein